MQSVSDANGKRSPYFMSCPYLHPRYKAFLTPFLPPEHPHISVSYYWFPVAVSSADCLCLQWSSVRWLFWRGLKLMPSWRDRTLAVSHTALQRAPRHQQQQHRRPQWLCLSLQKHQGQTQIQHSRKVKHGTSMKNLTYNRASITVKHAMHVLVSCYTYSLKV